MGGAEAEGFTAAVTGDADDADADAHEGSLAGWGVISSFRS
jgi:hypothetical protein